MPASLSEAQLGGRFRPGSQLQVGVHQARPPFRGEVQPARTCSEGERIPRDVPEVFVVVGEGAQPGVLELAGPPGVDQPGALSREHLFAQPGDGARVDDGEPVERDGLDLSPGSGTAALWRGACARCSQQCGGSGGSSELENPTAVVTHLSSVLLSRLAAWRYMEHPFRQA